MSLASKTPWRFNMGVELTLMPRRGRHPTSHYHHSWGDYTREYARLAGSFGLPDHHRIYRDPGCVEYPSPILKSWGEAREWYEAAIACGEMLGLEPFHPNHEGGMGHVHAGMTPHQAAKIVADLVGRPYLGWIFATPNNQKSCRSLLGYYTSESTFQILRQNSTTSRFSGRRPSKQPRHWSDNEWADQVYLIGLPSVKSVIAAARGGSETLEWRAFDSAWSWEMQEEHLVFLQRYYQKVNAQPYVAHPFTGLMASPRGPDDWPDWVLYRRGQREYVEFFEAYKSDKDRCIKEFRELLSCLELPWSRYEWYIERNLDPVFEWGYQE